LETREEEKETCRSEGLETVMLSDGSWREVLRDYLSVRTELCSNFEFELTEILMGRRGEGVGADTGVREVLRVWSNVNSVEKAGQTNGLHSW
jgi:hypothetical protein